MSEFRLNRGQQEAATSLGGPVLVTAGAGSGKTRVLTERCANAVVPGRLAGWQPVGVENLLAITFTEKAAGELAERVRATLRLAGCAEAARRIDAAWISTIHGMCSRILRSSALEAGLDPSFRLLDSVESATLQERAFEEAAIDELDRGAAAARLFALYKYQDLAEAVVAIHRDAAARGMLVADLPRERVEDPAALLAEVGVFYSNAVDRLQCCGVQEASVDDHLRLCRSLAQELSTLRDGTADFDAMRRLWQVLVDSRMPRTSKGIKEIKAEIGNSRSEFIARAVGLMTAELAEGFAVLADAYGRKFANLKRTLGALDFDDLQSETMSLLKTHPRLASDLQERFRVVMVDEFQDTDIQQLSIVRLLAGGDLCTVGDELQSIYGFRGADVTVYREHNAAMRQASARAVSLDENYRSHPDVLGLVNDVFGAAEVFAGRLVKLIARRDEPVPAAVSEDVARVQLLVARGGDTADDCRQAVADRIAERVAVLHDGQGVSLSDIVVLLRTYRHAEVYAEALRERGIEAMVVGGSRFLDQPEVSVLQSLCRVMANRLDEEALGVVLASPLCGLSDDGLMSLRKAVEQGAARTLWDALRITQLSPADRLRFGPLEDALNEVETLVGVRPLGELIVRVFERTGWDLRCLGDGVTGSQTYATVLKFARMATAFTKDGGGGPAAFSTYLDEKRRFSQPEPPAVVAGGGVDAVRLMSIHSSKGLEFPVVIVPELDSGPPADSGVARWDLRKDPRVGLQLPTEWHRKDAALRRSAWFDEIADRLKQEKQEEYLRLYYVAFTRAREVLILAGREPRGEALNMMHVVCGAVCSATDDGRGATTKGTPVAVDEIEVGGIGTVSAETDSCTRQSEPSDEDLRQWRELLRTSAAPSPPTYFAPKRLSYSALREYAACPKRYYAQRTLGIVDLDRSDSAAGSAADFGSAVHAALQGGVAPSDEDRLAALGRYHRLGAPEMRRLVSALKNYHRSDVAEQVSRAANVGYEVAFAIQVVGRGETGFVLDGSMDLYARDGARSKIIDCKTGTSGTADELIERYKLQARCYALAALAGGAEIVDVLFVRPEVLEGDGSLQRVLYEFSADDRSDIEEELLGMYRGISEGNYEPAPLEGSATCRGCPVSEGCPRFERGHSSRSR